MCSLFKRIILWDKKEPKYSEQRKSMDLWIKTAEKSNIKVFERLARTYKNWRSYILNGYKYGYTNGPTEGFNNKIKVLKRDSFGLKNFNRNRILLTWGQVSSKPTPNY